MRPPRKAKKPDVGHYRDRAKDNFRFASPMSLADRILLVVCAVALAIIVGCAS